MSAVRWADLKVHKLKTYPGPFSDLMSGRKRAEYRFNDRKFREGDGLLFEEWNPAERLYTGFELRAVITNVTTGRGIPEGYVMLSIEVFWTSELKALKKQLRLHQAGWHILLVAIAVHYLWSFL